MKKAVQFGAGNIGRGFLGQLFYQSGYKVVFIDVNKELVAGLNRRGSYPLRIVGNADYREITVKDLCAIHVDDIEKIAEEITEAEIMATAVGKGALKMIAPLIAQGLERRIKLKIEKPLNIIICENIFHGAVTLKEYILESLQGRHKDYIEKRLGLVESVVSRMVPGGPGAGENQDPLLVMAEEYALLPVAKNGFAGDVPEVIGMQFCDNLVGRQEQKMFTHNTGHSMCAYLGHLKGYIYIHEAIRDRRIKELVRAALAESGQALVKKHRIDAREHQDYTENLLQRFDNAALNDTVFRGAKDPVRKLGPEDRLIGAAKLALQFGIKPDCLALGIAAAVHYDNPLDAGAVRLSQLKSAGGVNKVFGDICGLDPNEELALLIKEKFSGVEQIRNSKKA